MNILPRGTELIDTTGISTPMKAKKTLILLIISLSLVATSSPSQTNTNISPAVIPKETAISITNLTALALRIQAMGQRNELLEKRVTVIEKKADKIETEILVAVLALVILLICLVLAAAKRTAAPLLSQLNIRQE